jgi:peptidyl-prolyl cis-trans isomerase SurA
MRSPFFLIVAALALVTLTLVCAPSAQAQVQTADKIVAVVGKSRIVLQSDLETRIAQMRQQDPTFSDSNRCGLLQQIMLEKLLVEQAERDSVLVSDEEVEGTLENRIRYFVRIYGSKERLEQASGKTIYQIKDENRETSRRRCLPSACRATSCRTSRSRLLRCGLSMPAFRKTACRSSPLL